MKEGLGSLGEGPCYVSNMLYPIMVTVLGGEGHSQASQRLLDSGSELTLIPGDLKLHYARQSGDRLMEVRWSVQCCPGSSHSGFSGC